MKLTRNMTFGKLFHGILPTEHIFNLLHAGSLRRGARDASSRLSLPGTNANEWSEVIGMIVMNSRHARVVFAAIVVSVFVSTRCFAAAVETPDGTPASRGAELTME